MNRIPPTHFMHASPLSPSLPPPPGPDRDHPLSPSRRRRLLFAAASYFLANKSLRNERASSTVACFARIMRAGRKERKREKTSSSSYRARLRRGAHCEVQSRRRRRQANVLRTKYIGRRRRRCGAFNTTKPSDCRIDARCGLSSNNTRQQQTRSVMYEGSCCTQSDPET